MDDSPEAIPTRLKRGEAADALIRFLASPEVEPAIFAYGAQA
jgi:hypothetical protein